MRYMTGMLIMKKHKLKGEALKQKHIHELIKQDKLIDLTKFMIYGYDKTKWHRLGGIYND